MEIHDYLKVLKQHWLLISLCVLLATAGAAISVARQVPIYQAQSELFVSAKDQASVSGLLASGSLAAQRVASYVEIINSPRVVNAVAAQLGIPAAGLAGEISATSPANTVLIQVSVSDPSPQRAMAIANAVGDVFGGVVNQIEVPNGSGSPVKISMVKPATLPGAPVSPKKSLDIGLGLVVGLMIGVGVAVLREALDNTIGSRHDAAKITGSAVLGAIAEDPEAKSRPLIVGDNRFSGRAEAFRQLRTGIRFLALDDSKRSFVVTSAVSAEGKTTTASNLAIALAQAGDRVVLVDADLRRPGLEPLLGLSSAVGLTNVLLGDVGLDDALQTWRSELPLEVLASGPIPPNPSELLGSPRMADLIATLTARADVVLFDSPPLLPVTDAAVLARLTAGAILVVRVGSTRADQLTQATATLATIDAPIRGVVLSRIPRRGKGSSYSRYSYGYGYRSKGGPDGAGGLGGSGPVPAPSPADAVAGSSAATAADVGMSIVRAEPVDLPAGGAAPYLRPPLADPRDTFR